METTHDLKQMLRPIRPLAVALGVSYQAVHKWRRVPAERVLDVERLRGISRSTLRPDLYPPEDRPA